MNDLSMNDDLDLDTLFAEDPEDGPVFVQPGHPIWELLDVGIPLAWELNSDLVASLRSKGGFVGEEAIPENSTGLVVYDDPNRETKLTWANTDEAAVVYLIKETLLDLCTAAQHPVLPRPSRPVALNS